jgi:hypothetical protein
LLAVLTGALDCGAAAPNENVEVLGFVCGWPKLKVPEADADGTPDDVSISVDNELLVAGAAAAFAPNENGAGIPAAGALDGCCVDDAAPKAKVDGAAAVSVVPNVVEVGC